MLRTLEVFLLPPLLPLVVAVAAVLVRRRRRVLGTAGLLLALALLIASNLPVVGVALLHTLQTAPALDLGRLPAGGQAIVVLSADMDVSAPEYGAQTVGPLTLQRIRYAAALHRETGLPVLVSGGQLPSHTEPHAASMQRVLERELGARVQWREDQSHTTSENARYSAAMLRAASIARVFLVTHAWHMPRAAACFARHGIDTIPAPTAFARWPSNSWTAWLPRWSGQRDVALALHEWLGRAHDAVFE